MQQIKFDYIYGKLLSYKFSVQRAKQLAKSLYTLSEQLNLTSDQVLKYVSVNGIKFDNGIYNLLNKSRTNSSQIGFFDISNVPNSIIKQIPINIYYSDYVENDYFEPDYVE